MFHSAWKQRGGGRALYYPSASSSSSIRPQKPSDSFFFFFFSALCSYYKDVRVLMWAVSYWDQTYCRPLPSFRKVLLMSRRGLNNTGTHPSGHTPYRSRWWLLLLLLRPSVKIKRRIEEKKTVRLFFFFYILLPVRTSLTLYFLTGYIFRYTRRTNKLLRVYLRLR